MKRWHWALLGAVAGAAIGWADVSRRENERIGGEGFIAQAVFEQEFSSPAVEGVARLRNFSIQHLDDVDIVDMERMGGSAASPTYTRVKFAAPNPYRPIFSRQPVGADYTVRQYMQDMARTDPKMTLRFAWWREPNARVGFWALGGIAVVGGVWPTLVRMMIGAGLGRPVKEKLLDLDQFKSEPQAKAAGPSEEEQVRLRALEEEMIRGMQQQPADVVPGAVVPAEAPGSPTAALVKKLEGDVLAPRPAGHEEDKHYKGEYYPVALPEGHDQAHEKGPHGPPPAASKGFTLIELVVVIAIIAMLIAILLPAIAGAKQRGQQVKCMAQLQQIGRALHMYANDNGGWLPEWSLYHTWPRGQSGDTPGAAWTEEMAKYLGPPDGPIYNCPSWPGPFPCRNYFLEARWSGLSRMSAMKLSDIRMSSRFVLSGDKTQRGGYPEPFGIDVRHPIDDSDPDDFGRSGNPQLTWPWQPGGFYMHRGGNNVLFDDGHVALFGKYDPTSMTFHPTKMQDWRDVTPGM
ncbi:MAG TPA: prepilin-type N-terminal cleavage/methylation domain-containing protein [Tepidisphaeraceae bacterium]|nr:prepilin-type N-terminal cleavage/methylation domain-containing protein [Tepidisphaeraceae bacterium]